MSWYPGSCNNDKSESVDVHVSCRQIAPKYKPCDVRLSITGNKLLNFALTLCIFNVSIKNSFGLFWNIDWTSDKSTYREWQKFDISCSESTKVDSTWLRSFSVPAKLSQICPVLYSASIITQITQKAEWWPHFHKINIQLRIYIVMRHNKYGESEQHMENM